MEAELINKRIEDVESHIVYYKLPEHLKVLSRKEKEIEIEKQISLLKEKGIWK